MGCTGNGGSEPSCGCSAKRDTAVLEMLKKHDQTAVTAARFPECEKRQFVVGTIQTPAGPVPQISTSLAGSDYIGALKVRFGFGRERYRVEPGLYAIGTPNERSDVLVTANYKLTFDTLRGDLAGLNAWLLVLDTKGINVWCAAGKGTFGTDELVKRIRQTSLEKVVLHRRLILPQLGATGVAAHLVRKESGFTVLYGPVRSRDVKQYIEASYKTTKEMTLVNFGFADRLILTPNDFMYGLRYLISAVVVAIILSGINRSGISFGRMYAQAFPTAVNLCLGYFAGIVITPVLLPYIPIRMFAFKGYLVGLITTGILAFNNMLGASLLGMLSWFLLLPAISSFMAMNFTGSSTYTSLSGVKKEMKIAVPVQLASVALGIILTITDNLMKGL